MEAIRKLQREGYQVSLDGEDIRCRKLEGANPDPAKVNQFIRALREHKPEAIEYLRRHFNHAHMDATAGTNNLTVFSKVLGRDIVISWAGDDPKVIYVDQTAYSQDEISRLKNGQITPQAIKTIHETKTVFDGELQD